MSGLLVHTYLYINQTKMAFSFGGFGAASTGSAAAPAQPSLFGSSFAPAASSAPAFAQPQQQSLFSPQPQQQQQQQLALPGAPAQPQQAPIGYSTQFDQLDAGKQAELASIQ